jgi:hypothetical protein
MALTYIEVTATFPTGAQGTLDGYVTFTPNALLADPTDELIIPPAACQAQVNGGVMTPISLACTDNANLEPSGWAWTVAPTLSGVRIAPYSVFLPHTGETVDLSTLTPVTPGPIVTAYAQLGAGNTFTEPNTFTDGLTVDGAFELDGTGIASPPGGSTEFLRADGTWAVPAGGGGGSVTTVFGRDGAVTAENGDYSAGQITGLGSAATQPSSAFDAAGSASAAQAAAESFATAAVAVETTRAEAAEAGKLPTTAAGTANGVATLDGSGHLPAAQGANLFSRQIEIAADGVASTVIATVGTWTPTYLMTSDTGGVWSGWINISDAAQNDSISFDFACGAGTYTIELLHLAYTNRGTFTVEVDGVSVGTVDGYVAALTPTRGLLSGVAISAGQHTLTLLMATKNASASGYVGLVERLILTRTA